MVPHNAYACWASKVQISRQSGGRLTLIGGTMASSKDLVEVKEMIQSLYRYAGIPVWDGEVNEEVARVFGIMLLETQKCSSAFAWIPPPPDGRASIVWLVQKLGRGIFNSYKGRLSFTCARGVIYKWKTALDMAAMGISTSRLPKWA